MAKVIVTDLDPRGRTKRARAIRLESKLVRRADGTRETVYVLDSQSPQFGDQFLKVFQLNVARARRRKPAVTAE